MDFLSWYQWGFWFTQGNGVLVAVGSLWPRSKMLWVQGKTGWGQWQKPSEENALLSHSSSAFLASSTPNAKKNFEIGPSKVWRNLQRMLSWFICCVLYYLHLQVVHDGSWLYHNSSDLVSIYKTTTTTAKSYLKKSHQCYWSHYYKQRIPKTLSCLRDFKTKYLFTLKGHH